MKIAKYLMDNYYAHTNRMDIVPTHEQINQAILNHPNKIIVVRDKGICGMAWFLTLSDETYQRLEDIDISRVDVLQALCLENGKNFHFVLLAANGFKTIKIGLRRALKLKPKTISWWNPNFTKLHRYIC